MVGRFCLLSCECVSQCDVRVNFKTSKVLGKSEVEARK